MPPGANVGTRPRGACGFNDGCVSHPTYKVLGNLATGQCVGSNTRRVRRPRPPTPPFCLGAAASQCECADREITLTDISRGRGSVHGCVEGSERGARSDAAGNGEKQTRRDARSCGRLVLRETERENKTAQEAEGLGAPSLGQSWGGRGVVCPREVARCGYTERRRYFSNPSREDY